MAGPMGRLFCACPCPCKEGPIRDIAGLEGAGRGQVLGGAGERDGVRSCIVHNGTQGPGVHDARPDPNVLL